MCWSNVLRRPGRAALSFVCITVVVAFFTSSMAYQGMLKDLMVDSDVHVRALLEDAGVLAYDAAAVARQRDQAVWLLSLSVFVCLMGIANTILMSVTERFREIGTLKCLGALDSFIIRLFLVESLVIGVAGSLVGGILGSALAVFQVGVVLEFAVLSFGSTAAALVSALPIAVGLGTLLTVVAAIYPTYVAARMKPVDAMRTEV